MRFGVIFAALAGFVAVGAFAPFGLFPLAPLSLALLFSLLLRAQGVGQGFALGFGWGLGFFLGGVSWLYVALNRYGGMPPALAGFAIFLFCAYLALFPATVGALYARLRRGGLWCDGLLVAGLWTIAEWLRGTLLTGFPWLAVGYSQTPPSPLAGFAPVIGVYGIGFIVAWIGALIAFAPWRRASPAPAVLLVVAVLAAGGVLRKEIWTRPVGEPLSVVLLQTNIEQGLKWQPQMLQRWLQMNLDLVREHPAQLVVLPETTLPLLADQLPAGYLDTLSDSVEGVGGDLVLGLFTRNAEGQISNAAISLGVAQRQHYAKRHLVPFGEYSPPSFGWFYEYAKIPMSDQTPGAADQPPMALGGQKIAVNICYEDLFGAEISRRAAAATMQLNLSNLAWYGDSLAQPQHLQIARMRALETGRPMLRSTNTGMTAVIQPDGRVSEVLPAFQSGALRAQLQGYQGMTPYLEHGDRSALGIALGAVLVALAFCRRRPVAV